MRSARVTTLLIGTFAATALLATGCRNSMPHAFTWPAGGDTQYTHAKPPEGGYYKNWDPYAVELEVTPVEDVNPVRTQHYLVATIKDKDGKPLPNRRVEWIISDGSVGDIVEVDESGWRASRGYKVTNDYAVSHTGNFDHVIDMGDSDPSNDLTIGVGQSWCVITSPIEGDSYVTVYAPGIYDKSKHKVFVTKHWYDVKWECPPPASNPTGTTHEFVTKVTKYSDGTPLAGYSVNYTIVDGPPATLSPGGTTATVLTDSSGMARVTIAQVSPMGGTNNVNIEIIRPENVACCKPAVRIATCSTSKTWVPPEIACSKTGPSNVMAGEAFDYTITVTNPSQVPATGVVVTDAFPAGITMISSNPPASGNTWSLGTIPGGGSQTITIQAKANNTGNFENCAEVRADQGLSSRCCTQLRATSACLKIEKRCPSEVTTCDTIEYQVTVSNPCDGPANNVRIEDRLPDGLITTDGKNVVAASVPSLAPGESKGFRYTVKASRPGSYTNRVTAMADGGLTAEASCTVVVRQPSLTVAKTGGRDMVFLGRPMSYDITVTNNGDTAATNTTLRDPLPAGLQFVSASDGGQFSGGVVTWSLGTLDPGQSRTVKLETKAMQAGSFKNVATVTAVCADAQAEVTNSAQGVPAILLEVVDQNDPDEVGSDEIYTITVTNQGSAEGTNIRIVAQVQPEAEYVSSDGSATMGTADGRTISFAPLPMLAPKARATFRVVVKSVTAGDTRFKVTMTSDQIGSPPVEETEATRFY